MKKSLFFGIAAFLAAGFASCSQNDLVADNDSSNDIDRSYFVNINISTVNEMGSRADDPTTYDTDDNIFTNEEPKFDNGDDNYKENDIKTIFLVFYDKAGDRIYTTQVLKENGQRDPALEGPDDKGKPFNPEEPESRNHLYSGVVQVDVKHGADDPAYVLCFINPITSQNFDANPNFATLENVANTTRERIIDDSGYFAMSKSTYFGLDRAENPDLEDDYTGKYEDKYTCLTATPLLKGQLFPTAEMARKNLYEPESVEEPTPPVDIYVERYAVKVNFKLDADAIDNEIIVDGHTLKFVPEYWAVNAYESNTYIAKSFRQQNLIDKLEYKDLNDKFMPNEKEGWFWNSPKNHRSYWAQSPAYYAQLYPRVADDILDLEETNAYMVSDAYALGYYSYDEMVANADPSKNPQMIIRKARNLKDDQDKVRPIYARENTVAGDALIKAFNNMLASPKAAIPSIVMVGSYTVDGQPIGKDENDEDITFYVTGNKTNGYKFYASKEEMLPVLLNTTVRFFASQGSANPIFNYGVEGTANDLTEQYEEYFTIEHPSRAVRYTGEDDDTGMLIDSRFVTIQLNKDKFFDGNGWRDNLPALYAYYNGKYQAVSPDNFDEINREMLYEAGTVQGFSGGKAYFTIPIKHLGYYRTNNPNRQLNANDKLFDWEVVQSGDFGLVRNHIYTIEVEKIEGLGNGIPRPGDPIVPPTDPEDYYIGARIIVLNWAVVPTQHVTL